MFVNDFVMNGQGHGPVAEHLAGCRFDPGLMRPFLDDKGRSCVTVNAGLDKDGKPKFQKALVSQMTANGMVINGPTALRKNEWIQLDQVVLRAARERLRAWSDLSAANSFGGFNGMAKLILEHETMSDPGEASVDFDGLTEARNDAPAFQLEGLPLPITHSDFWFSSRRLAVSRNTGTPLDTTMGEAAGRRVAEKIEKTLIGTVTRLTYGVTANYGRAPTVYGYTNFPSRLTKTNLTTPTGSNPEVTVGDVLTMIDQLSAQNFYGPFMLYHSTDWDKYMDNDYARLGGNNASMTLRDRLRAIESISDVRRLDFLKAATNPFTLLLVQMTSDVARAVNGMDITTVQWEAQDGMRLNFKVMCIMVPQLRADFTGQCGILHATTS
jgi:hypothetical protein